MVNKFKQIKAKHKGAKIVKPNLVQPKPIKELRKDVKENKEEINKNKLNR